METYTTWAAVPDHLRTKTQLAKDGLKPAPGQNPAGRKTGGNGPYFLYDKETAVPKRPLTEAQKTATAANLEKARAAQHCVDCGSHDWHLDRNGRCKDCRLHHQLRLETKRAGERLAGLAACDDWLIIDTETTGLEKTAEIIQIGIVDAAGRVVMSQLIKPSGLITPGAAAIHGIDATAVANAPMWAEVYPTIAGLLNGRHLLAYNVAFDQRLLEQTCNLHQTAVPSSSWECVMELTAAYVGEWSDYWQGFKWQTLTSVYTMLGIRPFLHELPPTHDAAGDAWLTWKLVQAFRDGTL